MTVTFAFSCQSLARQLGSALFIVTQFNVIERAVRVVAAFVAAHFFGKDVDATALFSLTFGDGIV